jgi:predicted acylesterase/phospholipase RssA
MPSRKDIRVSVEAARVEQDRELTCDRADHCAIVSPLRELGTQALALSSDGAPQHRVLLLESGQDSLLARIALIRSAQTSIEMQTFIFAEDDTGYFVLMELLQQVVPFERLPRMLRGRHLHALAVTASSYTSGLHATFYEAGSAVTPWVRSQRIAVSGPIGVQHLLASSAIPFVFPAATLTLEGESEWFGDGSMRQAAPISPAIHLGAQRVLVIGAGRMHEPPGRRMRVDGYPNLAQIAGHTLSSIFLDALAVDVERLQRVNNTLSLLPPSPERSASNRSGLIAPDLIFSVITANHGGRTKLTSPSSRRPAPPRPSAPASAEPGAAGNDAGDASINDLPR